MNVDFAVTRHIPTLLLFFISAAVISKPLEPPMVLVPAAEVTLGPTEFEDTTPMTQVSLDGFWVGKFEVTRREFAQFVKPAATTRLPATILAEHFSNMSNALVFPYDEHNQFVTGPLSGQGDFTLHYMMKSPSPGQYEVRLIGKAGAPMSYTVQHQDGTSGTSVLGDEHRFVFLAHAGEQTLTTGSAGWQLDSYCPDALAPQTV